MDHRTLLAAATLVFTIPLLQAQTPRPLTLAQAEEIAVRNHPRIQSARLLADAAKLQAAEARTPLLPTVTSNFTGIGADHNSTLSAGTLQTSSLYSRLAGGVSITQMITDFGRTEKLTGAARLNAAAQERNADNTRAAILIEVDQQYYRALAADAVLRVARAVVENRRLMVRQVRALVESSLKSTLDVSFAEVALSEAELALFGAESDVQASHAHLAAAMGEEATEPYELADVTLPPPLPSDPEALRAEALKQRPDLAALQLNREAALRFAQAEKALNYPTVTFLAAAGGLPANDPRLRGSYGAAGINISLPVFNGGLYADRQAEASLRASAAGKDVQTLTVRISEQVRVAWLEASQAFRRLDVSARMVDQAAQALRLARARYDIGLGSIVEVNQAQLSEVSAEITAATAKYDYLSRRAALTFVMGAL